MSIQFLLSADQLARLDQADELLTISRTPAFAEVRALFQTISYPVQDTLDRLALATAAGRPTHDQREAMQARFEGESGEVEEAVEAASKWIQRLHGRVRLAIQMKTPGASKIARMLHLGDARPESYRDGVAMMGKILDSADAVVLDPAFVAEGRRALAKLRGERVDAVESEFVRKCLTISLHDSLDELGEVFEELARAVELVELETGRSVPGFDLALLRGAVAKSGPKAAPAASPLPPMGVLPTLGAPLPNGVVAEILTDTAHQTPAPPSVEAAPGTDPAAASPAGAPPARPRRRGAGDVYRVAFDLLLVQTEDLISVLVAAGAGWRALDAEGYRSAEAVAELRAAVEEGWPAWHRLARAHEDVAAIEGEMRDLAREVQAWAGRLRDRCRLIASGMDPDESWWLQDLVAALKVAAPRFKAAGMTLARAESALRATPTLHEAVPALSDDVARFQARSAVLQAALARHKAERAAATRDVAGRRTALGAAIRRLELAWRLATAAGAPLPALVLTQLTSRRG